MSIKTNGIVTVMTRNIAKSLAIKAVCTKANIEET